MGVGPQSAVANRARAGALLCSAVLLSLLAACGRPAGTPCQIVGSGFHARDSCRHKCLSRWQVTCPNGRRVTPNTCSGAFGCTPGDCPHGQVCYHDDDPFDDRSFCVLDTTCGTLSPAALAAWERETVARQESVRREREAKAARRRAWQAKHGKGPAPEAVDPNRLIEP